MENKNESNTTTVYERLSKIRQEIDVPKKQFNKFGDFYYRSLEDILLALKPLCVKYNVFLNLEDCLELHGDRYYIVVKATLSCMDSPSYISSMGYAREANSLPKMSESQITGTASSYAGKYALNKLLLLDDAKDDDTRDNTTHNVESRPIKKQDNLQSYSHNSTQENLKSNQDLISMEGFIENYFKKGYKTQAGKILKQDSIKIDGNFYYYKNENDITFNNGDHVRFTYKGDNFKWIQSITKTENNTPVNTDQLLENDLPF